MTLANVPRQRIDRPSVAPNVATGVAYDARVGDLMDRYPGVEARLLSAGVSRSWHADLTLREAASVAGVTPELLVLFVARAVIATGPCGSACGSGGACATCNHNPPGKAEVTS